MILDTLQVDFIEFERQTGWTIEPRGACREDVCLPLPATATAGGRLDVEAVADALSMPLVADLDNHLWALGPPAGGHALTSARAPDLVLPDADGRQFDLASLRGTKVLLLAWASW
jgi:hypothetical protein